MNAPLTLLLIAEIFSVFTCIDALPGWWWGSGSKHKYWNRHSSGRDHICSVGQCVQAWKCPKSNHSSDRCGQWNNMVCCVYLDESILRTEQGDAKFSTTSAYPKATVEQGRRTTPQTNEFINENQITTDSPYNRWNTKFKNEGPKSVVDILKNSRDKGLESPPHKNNTWKKIRTTISWDKPRTDVRVVFPTESVWLSKKTSRPLYVTDSTKRTYDNKITNSWTTRSTTPSVVTSSYFLKNTKRAIFDSAFTTKKFNQTLHNNSTKSSVTRSTTTMRPWAYTTKHSKRDVSNPEYTTKSLKRTTDYKSTKLWSTRSTTIAPVRFNTRTTRKAANFPITGKPTEFGRTTTRAIIISTKSEDNRRQDWGKSTTTSTRAQTPKPKSTNKPVTTQSTRSSTRRYKVTTPLPNVNTYLCGIRDERSGFSRERRINDDKYNAAGNISPGGRSNRGRQPYQRIVGGEEVEPFSWPWVAALYKVTSPGNSRFLCAGSLINENFVLTAAHIFTPDDLRTASYFVMLGTHNAQDAVAQYLVSSILRHPEYKNRYYYHDIALLRLERPVSFNYYVMPVCLPSPDAPLIRDSDLQGKNVTVMGWGDEEFGGKSSRVLKEATFPVVSRTSCNASYLRVASNRFPNGITDDMLCAGDPNGGKDACQGDSGGPLTSMELGRYTQVGIVSFGYQCGDKEFPGVYTKVAPYLGWIAENTLHNPDYGYGNYDYY